MRTQENIQAELEINWEMYTKTFDWKSLYEGVIDVIRFLRKKLKLTVKSLTPAIQVLLHKGQFENTPCCHVLG
jgi:hypothetical protein